jgi:hypothetical protein
MKKNDGVLSFPSTHTTCCHTCRISLTIHRRKFLPCNNCNKVVCKNCFRHEQWKGCTWKEAKENASKWLCPACLGICTCTRCEKLQAKKDGNVQSSSSSKKTSSNATYSTSLPNRLGSLPIECRRSPADSLLVPFFRHSFDEYSIGIDFDAISRSKRGSWSLDDSLDSNPLEPDTDEDDHHTIRRPHSLMERRWSFNSYIPYKEQQQQSNKKCKIELSSDVVRQRLQELSLMEKYCEENISKVQNLLDMMKSEKEAIDREKNHLHPHLDDLIDSE